jgi:HlyD family secretion protein
MTQLISQPQDSQESHKELPQPERKPKHRLLLFIGLLAAGAGLTGLGYYLWRPKTEPSLEVSGRVEGYETNIGVKVPGRIGFIAVREGDTVHKGQVIVRLDDEEIQAQLKEAQARVDAAKHQEQQARLQMDVLTSRIQEAGLSWQQSQGDAQGRISQAQSNVAAAEAQLNQAQAQLIQTEAELKLAKTDRDRFAELVQGGAIAKQRFDQAQTQVESLTAAVLARRSMVEAAQRQVSANQGQLVQVQATSFNPGMRQAQIDALQKQLAQSHFQQKAAESEIARATAAQQQIAAKIKDLNVVSRY